MIIMRGPCSFVLFFSVFLFQFLCNVQQYCDSEDNKLSSHKQK